jgi:hypothetical protein
MFYYLVSLPLDGSVQILAKSKYHYRLASICQRMNQPFYPCMVMDGERLIRFIALNKGRVHV